MALQDRSDVGYVSAALKELGEEGPESREDANETQSAAFDIYDTVRDTLFLSYPWSWSLDPERRLLTADPGFNAATTTTGFSHGWNVPGPQEGNLRALFDSGRVDAEPRHGDWTRRGPRLLTNFAPAFAELQRDVGEASWPPLYVAALIPLLCSRFAQLVLEDGAIGDRYNRIFEGLYERLVRSDAQAKPAGGISSFSYVDARLGGPMGYGRRRSL